MVDTFSKAFSIFCLSKVECKRAVELRPPAVLCKDCTVKSDIPTLLFGNSLQNGYNAPCASSTINNAPYFLHTFFNDFISDKTP